MILITTITSSGVQLAIRYYNCGGRSRGWLRVSSSSLVLSPTASLFSTLTTLSLSFTFQRHYILYREKLLIQNKFFDAFYNIGPDFPIFLCGYSI